VFDEEHAAQRALEEVGAKEPLAPSRASSPRWRCAVQRELALPFPRGDPRKAAQIGETLNNGSQGKVFDIRISRPARFDSRRGRIDN
jgi:hypothetical protein